LPQLMSLMQHRAAADTSTARERRGLRFRPAIAYS
jgi:hypothetical protein